MAKVMLKNLDEFSSVYKFWQIGLPTFKVPFFPSDFEFWIGVNEY